MMAWGETDESNRRNFVEKDGNLSIGPDDTNFSSSHYSRKKSSTNAKVASMGDMGLELLPEGYNLLGTLLGNVHLHM